jgi:hypothetical protein
MPIKRLRSIAGAGLPLAQLLRSGHGLHDRARCHHANRLNKRRTDLQPFTR